MGDTTNIFNSGHHSNKALPEDKLIAYLEGRLSAAEQHEVELWLADEGMESDAVEGLKNIHTGETKASIKKLNQNLYKSVHSKKRRRRPLLSNQFTLIAIVIILLLIVIAYIVIRKSI